MPTLEKLRAISIEYLPTEREMDPKAILVVGHGLMDNFKITEDLGYETFFGLKRYLCGLDVEKIKRDEKLNEAEKKAKVEETMAIIERLEKFYGAGQLDPTNEKVWGKVKLTIERKTTNLNLEDPRTEVILYCIKAGGFPTVAPSLEAARAANAKFYLVEPVEFAENRVATRKILDEATYTLYKLDESKSFNDIFYIGKYLLPVDKSYTKRTPKPLIYEDLSKFLNGEVVKQTKVVCARQFMEATKKDKANLVVSCFVKDALDLGFIYINAQGELKNNETGGLYGTTQERAVAHLQNPAYEHELDNIKTRVEKKWSE